MTTTAIQSNEEFVVAGLRRLTQAAESVGDIKTALRALTHLSKILGMIPAAVKRMIKAPTVEPEKTPEQPTRPPYLDKKGRYLGIELPMPLNSGKFKHGPKRTT